MIFKKTAVLIFLMGGMLVFFSNYLSIGQTPFPIKHTKILDSDIQYSVEDLGGNHGLNSSEISELFQDVNGFIWVGTKAGLSRFDGYEFTNFIKAGDRSFGQIHAIDQDLDSTLWVGGDNGLFYLKDGRFFPADLGNLLIRDLHMDKNQNLWVVGFGFIPFYLTPDQRFNILGHKKFVIEPIVSEKDWDKIIGVQHTWAIDTDGDGIVWLGLDDRHAFFDGNGLHVTWKDTTNLFEFSAITAFHRDSVFWGCEDIGLLLQRNGELEMPIEEATYLMAETDTSTYFLTTRELLELKDGTWTRLHSLDEYSFEYIYAKKLILDQEGNFWIGGVGNLLKLTPARLKKWAYPTYIELTSNHGLEGKSNGEILIGSFRGQVIEKSKKGFELIHRFDVPTYSYVGDILIDQRGWTWYVTSASGIVLDRGGELTYFTTENGLADNAQLFLYSNVLGELWAGGELGISRIFVDDDARIHFKNYSAVLNGKGAPMFRDLYTSPDGSIWAVSDQGMYTIKDDALIPYNESEFGKDRTVFTGAVVDRTGHVWLSSQGNGLWQCEFDLNGQPLLVRQWTSEDGLLSDVLLDVHLDHEGRIWTPSQNGISNIELGDNSWNIRVLDHYDGWPETASPHAEIYEDNIGNLWVMNYTSLVSIPIYSLPLNRVPPEGFITKVELIEGQDNIFDYSDNDQGLDVLPEQLTLPYDKNYLRFHFTSNSFTQPENNRFFYRLAGLDHQWTEALEGRSAPYPGLQPGSYIFEVEAINNDGIPATSTAVFHFSIAPPWYKTWWAYLTWLLLMTGGLIYFYRYQLSQKVAQQQNIGIQFYSEESRFVMDLDPSKLEMILTNLLTNALKFTPEYGTILVVAKRIEKNMRIEVKDSGVGIHSDELPHIFDRFHQASPVHGRKGIGIGLALVKELIHVLNGRVEVQSQPGKGSTFAVYLPIHFKAPLQQPISYDLTTNKNIQGEPVISLNQKDDERPLLLLVEEVILHRLEDENLSANELAQELHLSTSQTYRKLKALTGMSTAIYIRTVRLEKAKVLLQDRSRLITDIAYQTGFNTPVYFSQSFKETFGMSPSEYRAGI